MVRDLKLYVVVSGESFDDAVEGHDGKYFKTIEEAREYAFLWLAPEQKYMICDENGGVLYFGRVPRQTGYV